MPDLDGERAMPGETPGETGSVRIEGVQDRHVLKVQEDLWVEALALAAVVESTFALSAVRDALDALARSDAGTGRTVIAGDRRLDRSRHMVRAGLIESIRRDPHRVEDWLRLIDIARHLERVGDHAASIAEAAVYLK